MASREKAMPGTSITVLHGAGCILSEAQISALRQLKTETEQGKKISSIQKLTMNPQLSNSNTKDRKRTYTLLDLNKKKVYNHLSNINFI